MKQDITSTGASSGIGAGTAKMFAKLGASLALTGRNEDNLKKNGDECEKLGGNKVIEQMNPCTN